MTFKIYENKCKNGEYRYTYGEPAKCATESRVLVVRIPKNPYFALSVGWKFMGNYDTIIKVSNGHYYSINKILRDKITDDGVHTPIIRAYDSRGNFHSLALEVLSAPFRYYSTERPLMPGGFPKKNKVTNVVNFDDLTHCEAIDMNAWGYIEYSEPLTDKEEDDYQLTRDFSHGLV